MKKFKKKILYVHHAGNFGGAPKSMSYIIKNLDDTKYDAKLINITVGPINEFFRKELPVPLEIVGGMRPFHGSTVISKSFKLLLKNYLFFLPSLLKAYKILKKEKPDLIHLNSTCLFVFAIAAKILNIPVIVHVREPLRNGLWGAPLRFFNKKNVTGIIAISNFDLASLRIKSQKLVFQVIYNFVEKFSRIKNNDDSFRRSLGIAKNDVVFLYLARFAKGNGWEELINMAGSLVAKNEHVHFILAGADEKFNKSKYETKNIHIIPFQQDVNTLLNSADIYVCPFTEPHFARGVIEASAFSLPIIGADIGGVNELVLHDKTGYLYEDGKGFIEYAEHLVSRSDVRKEMGEAGYLFAQDKFEMSKNLKTTYALYEKVLAITDSNLSKS